MAPRIAALPVLALALVLAGAEVSEPSRYLSPATLVADADGRRLYVAEFTARQIAVFEIARQSVLLAIPLPDRPSGMALSADGSRLYVTGGVADGKVHVVDTR